ncbi:MAG: hypothetical protein Q7R79_04245, partial [bacterium]|nr:hypothetical protein [bacterium]
ISFRQYRIKTMSMPKKRTPSCVCRVSIFVMLFTSFFFISSLVRAQTPDTGMNIVATVPEQSKKQPIQEKIIHAFEQFSSAEKLVVSLLGISIILIGSITTYLLSSKGGGDDPLKNV